MFRKFVQPWQWLAFAVLLGISVYTQFYKLLDVPGLHFDEAWQGLYAHRIAFEPGFWPWSAMNSYTCAIVHYLLAAIFRLFGPTLPAMRLTYGIMNLTTMIAIAALLWRWATPRATTWFLVFWALLPLSVHDHRFYIEMTGFHGLCTAALLWGLALWNQRPWISGWLVTSSLILGILSHILFVSVFLSLLILWPLLPDSSPRRSLLVASIVSLAVAPLALQMGLSLNKKLPLMLALFFASCSLIFAAIAVLQKGTLLTKFRGFRHQRFAGLSKNIAKAALLPAIPFSLFYIGYLWNGAWTYAQVSGAPNSFWIPVNAILFATTAMAFFRQDNHELTLCFGRAFLLVFVISSALILKQAPRYYMVATILGMIWSSLVLSRLKCQRLSAIAAVIFVCWNGFAFQQRYIFPFENFGGTDQEFKSWRFKDSSRDFRPFQKAFRWAQDQGCASVIHWVEDDRFLRPVQFLQLSTPMPQRTCPWGVDDLLFSRWPPAEIGHVKIVAQRPEWGDLTFSERIEKKHPATQTPPVGTDP